MKIIIVGAGIGGLSLYLSLQKRLPKPSPETQGEVIIYESHRVPKAHESSKNAPSHDRLVIGGGLGVAPNGMKSFGALNKGIHDDIMRRGYPVRRFQIKNARNWTLGAMGAGGDGKWSEYMVMVCRQDVWDVVRQRVPDDVVRERMRVKEVRGREGDGGKCQVVFEDGTTDEADLIIGADGVKSVVRTAILGPGYPPKFEGLLGVGGICPSSYLPPLPSGPDKFQSPTVMTFGPNGFFGYSISSSAADSDVSGDPPPAYGPEAFWWSSFESKEVPDTKEFDPDDIKKQLLERHANWKDPTIQDIVKHAKVDLATQSWTTPKLPTWHKDGLILLGDAAHALPTTSGQGVSNTLEDCHALSILLAHFLSLSYSQTSPLASKLPEALAATSATPPTEAEAVDLAAVKYTSLRRPRVEYILDYSSRMASKKKDLGFVAEMVTYFFFWLLCKFMTDKMTAFMYDYDVETEAVKALGMDGKEYEEAYTKSVKGWLF